MNKYTFQNDPEEISLTGVSSKSKSSCTKTCIILVSVITIIVILGLALGLGLRKSSAGEQEVDGCVKFEKTQSKVRKTPVTNGAKWLKEDCTLADSPECPSGFHKPLLLIISLDGFRAEYLSRNLTPVMDKISKCGVKTKSMRPVFPSKTFPNHYGIVTGLYPESHGIIDNKMVDIDLEQVFTLRSEEKFNPEWWFGEPIWVTARKAGKKSATMFWPGSETKINGYYPNRCYWYDKSVTFQMRVDRVLDWLEEPYLTRPDVINLYMSQPDSAGHKQGPYGPWVDGNLTMVDNLLGDLMDGLIERKLHKCIDIIIVADHGMTPISKKRKVDIKTPLHIGRDGFVIDGEMARVTTKYTLDRKYKVHKIENGATADELVSRLACVNYNTTRDFYTKVYKKGDLPVRAHYGNSHRIEEVIVTATDQWYIEGGLTKAFDGGAHGYDNIDENMQAMFMAYGPSMKKTEIEPFENIELYNLMAAILQITPAPNNGTAGRLNEMLRHPQSPPTDSPPGTEYQPAMFPDAKADRDARRAASDCNCTSTSGVDVDTLDLRLDLTSGERAAAEERHLGKRNMPILEQAGLQVWTMAQDGYVSAYSTHHHMPLWAAFELNEQSGTDLVSISGGCSRVDVRLDSNETTSCAKYTDVKSDVTAAYLVPPGIVKDADAHADAEISTNLVPMYTTFRKDIWRVVLEVLAEYRAKYRKLQVLMGPVFDENRDGLFDTIATINKVPGNGVPMPSHYFVMLTRCTNASSNVTACPQSEIDTMAMIIPHLKTPGNCWNMERSRPFEYLQTHVARVRDIELITGLRLLRGIPDFGHGLLLRTRLVVGLWARTGWLDNQQCPQLNPANCSKGGADLPVLLISLDGFRSDYMDLGLAPVLEKLGACGVSTSYMRSVYPALTFPNHYSIVTGLYPESHGIAGNTMFDPKINSTFRIGSSSTLDTRWWGGEPIWNTVKRQGKKAAVYFWPGSDVNINGMRPDVYFPYDGSVPYSKRVDTVLDWLTGTGGLKADLAILYFDYIDKAGHSSGPNSPEVSDAISYVDSYLRQLMDGLKSNGIDGCVNIVVTSDHGMANIDCDRAVQISDLLSSDILSKTRLFKGAAGRLATTYDKNYNPVAPENRVSLDQVVYNTSCKSEHMNVYKTKSLPKRFHYSNNERIGDVMFMMDESWLLNYDTPWCGIKGNHGWDPMTSNAMKALFRAYGPSFGEKILSPAFENIEIYNLLTKLLSIDGASNNGTEGSMYHLLASQPTAPPIGGFVNYTKPKFPSTDTEYANRTTSDGCSCQVPIGKTVKQYDERLKLNSTRQIELSKYHLPHGLPRVDGQLALMSVWAEDYLTAYSTHLRMPVWVAYTVTSKNRISGGKSCLRPDVRLKPKEQATCANFPASSSYIPNFLFPPRLATSEDSLYDAFLLTNTVPMRKNFASGVWRHLVQTIYNWTTTVGTLHVISGPVFDYDADGIADKVTNINITVGDEGKIPVPSHFFVIMLRCTASSGNCSDMSYVTQAFIIPHLPNVTNCMDMDTYLRENRARVRDVELVTGLQLLTEVGKYESPAVHARTAFPWTYGFSTAA